MTAATVTLRGRARRDQSWSPCIARANSRLIERPAELVERIRKAETFKLGFATTEAVAAGLLELAWHTRSAGSPPADVDDVEREALDRFKVNVPAVPPRYRTPYFSHVWSGSSLRRPARDPPCACRRALPGAGRESGWSSGGGAGGPAGHASRRVGKHTITLRGSKPRRSVDFR